MENKMENKVEKKDERDLETKIDELIKEARKTNDTALLKKIEKNLFRLAEGFSVLNINKDSDEALKYYKKCLDIKREVSPLDMFEIGNILELIADQIYYHDIDFDAGKALKYYNEALSVYMQTVPKSRKRIQTNLCLIGSCLEYQEKYDEALKAYDESLEKLKEIMEFKDEDLETANLKLGILAQEKPEKYSERLEWSYQLTDFAEWVFNRSMLAAILKLIGSFHYELGDYEKALNYLKQALEEANKAENKDDSIIKDIKCQIELAYKKMIGNLEEAMKKLHGNYFYEKSYILFHY